MKTLSHILFYLLGLCSLSIADVATPLPAPVAIVAEGETKKKGAPVEPQKAPKPYPLTTCIVTDNDLDSMGEQTSFVYEGQTIKVCCSPCIAKFKKNPAKYLKKLEGK